MSGRCAPYLAVLRLRARMETQYRAAALGGLLTQVFFGLLLTALYRALHAPDDPALPGVITYVWLQQAFFRLLFASDAELTQTIRTGGMAYQMARPVNLYGYYYMRSLAQMSVGALMRAAPLLAFAALPGVGLGAPASLPALLSALLSLSLGTLCLCALEGIATAATLRTLDSRGVQMFFNALSMFFSGNILPLTLFPDRAQAVITRTPWAQALDTPIRLYTGAYPVRSAPSALLTQALWLAALVLLGAALWRRNLTRMRVQGG